VRANKNDGSHVEQKNWSVVGKAVGYHRYDTAAELTMLNEISPLLRLMTNFMHPNRSSSRSTASEGRSPSATTRGHALPAGPDRRARHQEDQGCPYAPVQDPQLRTDPLRPARAPSRASQDRQAKHQPAKLPNPPTATRAKTNEATKTRTQADVSQQACASVRKNLRVVRYLASVEPVARTSGVTHGCRSVSPSG
jgi:hypothetical protein